MDESGRDRDGGGEVESMRPDLESILLRNSVGSMETSRTTCSACRRTPLAGERLHRLDSEDVLCDLCLASVPEERRESLSSERMLAGERRLPVIPRAA